MVYRTLGLFKSLYGPVDQLSSNCVRYSTSIPWDSLSKVRFILMGMTFAPVASTLDIAGVKVNSSIITVVDSSQIVSKTLNIESLDPPERMTSQLDSVSSEKAGRLILDTKSLTKCKRGGKPLVSAYWKERAMGSSLGDPKSKCAVVNELCHFGLSLKGTFDIFKSIDSIGKNLSFGIPPASSMTSSEISEASQKLFRDLFSALLERNGWKFFFKEA
ncbi:EC1118_1H13_1090p [Saccharomyces cerevisiae EC1118]|uniref:EC1118_1H13_1090p n=1 Tax=Saccharomyces cerevisiae (strain Lalvin EC1118 / Prise de mousse) TaxID=643680 RepID=C8Z9T3_YEAS8|nr:EC1118_1H13_1090p [Saccharomyces cerevisiae EC1118]